MRHALAVVRWHRHCATLFSSVITNPLIRAKQASKHGHSHELTPEHAGRLTAIAVTADLEYWARTAAVDGRVGLNDLTRALDVVREASTSEVGR